MENIKLVAVNIAENINIKQLKANFKGKLIMSTSTELFYQMDCNKYISIFNYGVVAFSNHAHEEIEQVISDMGKYINDQQERLSETIQIEFRNHHVTSYENEVLSVPLLDNRNELFRIVMFDLSQTVALDYYSDIAEKLLQEVKTFAAELERKGKIFLSKKEMMKFIGKSLNTRNEIIDNLYVFDSPDLAWDDEKVEKVHIILTKTFDLNVRFKEIEYTFNIIDSNLQVFKETYEHHRSVTLEIVVIFLILIEVLKSFAEKFNFF